MAPAGSNRPADAACRISSSSIPPIRATAHYRIADGHLDNGLVHVSMLIGAGRDADTKQRAAQAVFDALLSFEHNNLHDYVKAGQAGREKP